MKTNKIILPEQVLCLLNELRLAPTANKKAVAFLQILTQYAMREYKNENPFFIFSSKRFRSDYGGNYKTDFLNLLLKNNIVQCDDYYSKNAKKALGYCINADLFDGSFEIVEIKTSKTIINYEGVMSNLLINSDKIKFAVNAYIDSIDESTLNVITTPSDNPIEFRFGNESLRRFSTSERILAKFLGSSQKLIKCKNTHIVDVPANYINRKKKNVAIAYGYVMARLTLNDYSSSRNSRNGRLDSIFTSMPKVMLNVIKADNNLTELDIKNSQFAIFAHVLKNDAGYRNLDDVKQFVQLASTGSFYEKIAKIFKVERSVAKIMMMEILFSHPVLNATKKQFQQHFPNVYAWATNYKKEHGSAEFAVMLQRKESEIFIDNLLPMLNKAGFEVITKHDSLIVHKENKGAIIQIMNDYFNSIDFECQISNDVIDEKAPKVEPDFIKVFEKIYTIIGNSMKARIQINKCIKLAENNQYKRGLFSEMLPEFIENKKIESLLKAV